MEKELGDITKDEDAAIADFEALVAAKKKENLIELAKLEVRVRVYMS